MGDQVGEAIAGNLYFIDKKEFDALLKSELPIVNKAKIFAEMCRVNTLYMIAKAGSGHIGSSFSSMEMFVWMILNELTQPNLNDADYGDLFFSSKGHDSPGLYSVLLATGRIEFDYIHKLRRLNGLPGHPDIKTKSIVTNTGSLGMGVSKAKGFVLSNRILNINQRVFVLTGDGELQEGQFWESLISAVNYGMKEITVLIDHNKLQSDTFVKNVSDLGDLEGKLKSFGWCVARCDGNDIESLSLTLEQIRDDPRPKVLIADTIKGKGVTFMEHLSLDSDVAMYKFHSGAPDSDSYINAVHELIDKLRLYTSQCNFPMIELESVDNPKLVRDVPGSPQKLIAAYSAALVELAKKRTDIVVLDADLILDTGLIAFRDNFPKRFIECGIAEQDMVSLAGAVALKGLLPIVHSFACFLSARPNEQIYNNATERKKIIYTGSLAGLIPGGPGHSHQAVRDISTISAIPGLIAVEPCCEAEVIKLLDWAVNENPQSTYLRMVSVPCAITFNLPANYQPVLGQGVTLKDGEDIAFIAYGPWMLEQVLSAARRIQAEYSKSIKVINLPWLNYIDSSWFVTELGGVSNIYSFDNHFRVGGQGERIAELIAINRLDGMLHRIALDDIPESGANDEILEYHKLDCASIVEFFVHTQDLS